MAAPKVSKPTGMMKILGKEDILKADDVVTESVDVPEWGGIVKVRGLTGSERDHFETASIVTRRGNRELNTENLRARLVVMCVVDGQGARVFADEDAKALGAKASSVVSKLYLVAARLSGITEADEKELTEDFTEAAGADSSST